MKKKKKMQISIIISLLIIITNRRVDTSTYPINIFSSNKELFQNPFHQFHKRTALVTSGTITKYNSCTVGWGTIGVIWFKPVMIVYIKPERYTWKFMEENDYFTVSFFGKKHRKQMGFFGSKSGRDFDKTKETGFHPIEVNNTVTYEEAEETYVCKKIYSHHIDKNKLEPTISKSYDKVFYFYSDNVAHYEYIGEIVNYIKKKN